MTQAASVLHWFASKDWASPSDLQVESALCL